MPSPVRERFYLMTGAVADQLRFLAESGCPGFDLSSESLDILEKWRAGKPSGRFGNQTPETLDDIRRDLGDCRRCELCQNRNFIVFGKGDPKARLMFVGKGPGAEEDRQGQPFVGEAGGLLTKIIHAIGENRESVYITDLVKCLTPNNRNPQPNEIAACLPFLKLQISAVSPRFVCVLGDVAAKAILETNQPIFRLRGRFHDVNGVQVMPTFHPAFLLSHPERKRDVWEDMKKLMAAMKR